MSGRVVYFETKEFTTTTIGWSPQTKRERECAVAAGVAALDPIEEQSRPSHHMERLDPDDRKALVHSESCRRTERLVNRRPLPESKEVQSI